MVSAWNAARRKDFAGERSKPPLHPVADDRSADLLGDGEADALGRIAVGAVADQQNEAGR